MQFNLNSATTPLQSTINPLQIDIFAGNITTAPRVASTSLGKIFLIDRDTHITELLRLNLHAEGYDVQVHPDADTALKLDLSDTRLVIIDAFGQPEAGNVLRELTSNPGTAHIGVIVCSAGESTSEAITALDNGADDYIAKPFSLREMIARVRAVMRRRRPAGRAASSSTAVIGPLCVDYTTRTASLHGRPLSLTPTEYAILTMLLKNRGRHLSRLEIFRNVWSGPDAGNNERVVDTNISRLRRKLGELGTALQNHSGSGYIFVEPMALVKK